MIDIEKASALIQSIADQYNPKTCLYYPVFVDRNGNYKEEVDDDQYGSICEDCVNWAVDWFHRQRRPNGKYNGRIIELWAESMPENDDFVTCGHCGNYIDVGVLHTFSQEIDHWTDVVSNQDFKESLTNPKDVWVMYQLLTNKTVQQVYPSQIQNLANRIWLTLSPETP